MASEAVDSAIPVATAAPARKFGVADAMILVVGLSLALAAGLKLFVLFGELVFLLCRTIADYNSPFFAKRPGFWWTQVARHWSSVLFYGVRIFEFFLLGMTPAFLLVRLRRPRPAIRALLRQPGTVAALAIVFGQVWVTGWLHRLFFGRLTDPTVTAVAVGGTVTLAWALLALSRKWEGERSWVDRMGRLLGVGAIVTGAIAYSVFGI